MQKLQNIAANQFIKIREGATGAEKLLVKKLEFKASGKHNIPACAPVAKAAI